MNQSILDLVRQRLVLLDGAMGTELMRLGLPQGIDPEIWSVENPSAVKDIHRRYFEAGADAVTTNTLGGNRIKLAGHGHEERVRELNMAAVRAGREAAPPGKFVGGSMGPTGKFLRPQGEFTEKEFEDVFAEQAMALAEAGVDFFIIETQYDLKEALAALKGTRRASPLPAFVTMTFNKLPRGFFTLMGNTPTQCVEALEKEGAAAVGANCTLDSEDMAELIPFFKKTTRLPIIAQANAGRPVLSSNGQVSYSQGPKEYVRFALEIVKSGARIVGGCCGTDPEYIREMAGIFFTPPGSPR